jgi:hypothetical protein
MEVPLKTDSPRAVGGILSPDQGTKRGGLSAERVCHTSLPVEFLDELSHLTQSLKVEKVCSGDGRRRGRRIGGVIGRAERHGGMAAIGQPHDDVRTLAAADTDDGQLLSTEGMMGMRDGYAFGRRWGRKGSALGMCPR